VEKDMMKTCLKLILAVGIGFGGLGLAAASAMPVSDLDPAIATPSDTAKNVESVRWICGPYGGCRWVSGWRRYWGPGYGYWRPRRWGYGYGYNHPWGGYYGEEPWIDRCD
jgi:hypothetical protein